VQPNTNEYRHVKQGAHALKSLCSEQFESGRARWTSTDDAETMVQLCIKDVAQ